MNYRRLYNCFSIIAATACAIIAQAQTEILTPLGLTQIYAYQFVEQQKAHYFLTAKYNPNLTVSQQHPVTYTLHKTDKNAHTILLTKTVMGDSYQADSVVNFYARLLVKNDKIHLFYTKTYLVDSTFQLAYKRTSQALCYQQLDTNFNTIIPEKKIVVANSSTPFFINNVSTAIDLNNNVAVGCTYFDTSYTANNGWLMFSKYHILNSNGCANEAALNNNARAAR